MREDSFDSEENSFDSELGNETEAKSQKDESKIKNKSLINAISNTLSTIIEENKRLPNIKEIIKKQSKMVFSSNTIPNISICDYLLRIQTYSFIEKSTLILSLILIDHICKKTELVLTYYNIHRLVFTSILISIKFNEDTYYDNKFYSEIAGVKLKELKLLEYTFLALNDFNIFVNSNEFEKYQQYLEDFNQIRQKEKS